LFVILLFIKRQSTVNWNNIIIWLLLSKKKYNILKELSISLFVLLLLIKTQSIMNLNSVIMWLSLSKKLIRHAVRGGVVFSIRYIWHWKNDWEQNSSFKVFLGLMLEMTWTPNTWHWGQTCLSYPRC